MIKLRRFKAFYVIMMTIALFASVIIPASADTTSDYSEDASYVDASHARITFESYVSSTYVYLHYKVNNGSDLNYLMSQNGNTWTYDIGGLNANDVVSYWFTYQTGSTQQDTTHWGHSYTHTSSQTGTVATPTFSPAGGAYGSAQTVTISSTTSGAAIYYTTDGTTPTSGSSLYSSPITVSSSTTLKAIAVKSGLTTSSAATAAYTIGAVSDYSQSAAYVDASHANITFVSNVSSTYVYLHYKVNNGSDLNYLMSQSGNIWTYDIGSLNANDVVSYWFTYQIGSSQQDTAQWGFSYTHTSQPGTVSTPTFSPAGGTYSSAQTVTISSATSGAAIYYTTDGTTPTSGSSLYSSPITVSSSTTLKAIAVKSGMTTSSAATAAYTINTLQQAATPTFSPAGGTYSSAQTVTISSATSGAAIYYTTDGTTPTSGSSLYSSPIAVSSSQTLKAIAVKSGLADSTIATAYYTIGASSGLAKFEPADGKTLIAIGQAKGEMDAYQALSDIPDPAGYMIYTSTLDAGGMTGPVDKGAGVNDFSYWAANKTDSVAQLGIDMVDYAGNPPGQQEVDKVAAGQRDANLITIATAVKNAGKPVFVRIGYEADSPWNHYEAASYIEAYRHVHDIFRQEGASNAAFVWSLVGFANSGGPAPYYSPIPIESWYPGDDYVDWVSISWFGWATSAEESAAAQSRQDAVSFASNHDKPLMIAEAAPRTYNNMLLTNSSTWDNFFQPIFDFIAANNVKMFCYINQDWSAQPIFSDPMWGDSRIQQAGASYIYGKWKTEITKSRYLNASSGLYGAIGFNPSDPAQPAVPRPIYDLPGRVEAENWNEAQNAYNTPLAGPSSTDPNNMALCWLSSASTMSYRTNATSAGSYTFALRIANGSGTPTTATIKVDGSTVATVTIPTTADWDTYTTAVSSPASLSAGTHTVTIVPGGTFNFDWFEANP